MVHFLINAILVVPHSTLANVQFEFHIVRCECEKKENNCVDKRTKAGRCVRSFFFCRQLDFPFRERERDSEPSGALPNQCGDGSASASAAFDDDDEDEEEEKDDKR